MNDPHRVDRAVLATLESPNILLLPPAYTIAEAKAVLGVSPEFSGAIEGHLLRQKTTGNRGFFAGCQCATNPCGGAPSAPAGKYATSCQPGRRAIGYELTVCDKTQFEAAARGSAMQSFCTRPWRILPNEGLRLMQRWVPARSLMGASMTGEILLGK